MRKDFVIFIIESREKRFEVILREIFECIRNDIRNVRRLKNVVSVRKFVVFKGRMFIGIESEVLKGFEIFFLMVRVRVILIRRFMEESIVKVYFYWRESVMGMIIRGVILFFIGGLIMKIFIVEFFFFDRFCL